VPTGNFDLAFSASFASSLAYASSLYFARYFGILPWSLCKGFGGFILAFN